MNLLPAPDQLSVALGHFNAKLDRSIPLGKRVQNFWAIVVAVRGLAAADVLRDELTRLAGSSGLMRDLAPHGAEDIEHLIRWGLLNRWPFDRQWSD